MMPMLPPMPRMQPDAYRAMFPKRAAGRYPAGRCTKHGERFWRVQPNGKGVCGVCDAERKRNRYARKVKGNG